MRFFKILIKSTGFYKFIVSQGQLKISWRQIQRIPVDKLVSLLTKIKHLKKKLKKFIA